LALYYLSILYGALLTVGVSLAALAVSVLLGLLGAGAKLSGSRLLVALATGYTTVIRGIPELVLMLLVFVPMLLPAAKVLEIDLVHFGVVVVVNMMIGLVTPPFGMLLFVTNALTGIPIRDMIREGWLFLAMLVALMLMMVLFPQIVLWLPQTMGYGVQ